MTKPTASEATLKLIQIMSTLRSPEGCPWDQQQTAATLKPFILEEAYELIEAIDGNDAAEIQDELGDLLLQVVFLAQIYQEQKLFDFTDVALAISNKMIRRHPHVFAAASATDHARRWDEIKQQERALKGKGNKLTDRIPATLPALKKAAKVISKMTAAPLETQIQQNQDLLSQLKTLTENPQGQEQQIEKNLSDFFFGAVQMATTLNFDAEDLLRQKTTQVIAKIESQKNVNRVINCKVLEK